MSRFDEAAAILERANREASVSAHKELERELRAICDRLRPGRKVRYKETQWSADVTITTELGSWNFSHDRLQLIPLTEDIYDLVMDYEAISDDFYLVDFSFTTGETK